jgi:hypothetical protein
LAVTDGIMVARGDLGSTSRSWPFWQFDTCSFISSSILFS